MKRLENERIQKWMKDYFEIEIKKLSPRIQNDIQRLSFQSIDDVQSSYLWGLVGSGKTIHSIFMMLSYLRNEYVLKYHKKVLFITVPELLFEFKSSYSNHNKKDQPTEEEILEKYSKVDLLVLDDFGIERINDWSFQLLYILINRRYENLKKIIFTSNFNLEQLSEKLGDDRIPSRIQQLCEIIEFKGKDYRMNK